jgi:hypothetical protein
MGALQKDSGGDQDRVWPVISMQVGAPVGILRHHDDLYNSVRLASVRQRTLAEHKGSSAETSGREYD